MNQAEYQAERERLRRQLAGQPNADRQRAGDYAGAQADLDTGMIVAGVSGWRSSVAPGENKIKKESYTLGTEDDWRKPTVKRQPNARVESLARRLWACVRSGEGWQIEMILREMQVEYWREGQPVTYDALRQLAQEQIRLAELAQKEAQRRQVTR